MISGMKCAKQLWPLFYVPEAGDVVSVTIPKANLKCFYNKMCRFYKHKHKFILFLEATRL